MSEKTKIYINKKTITAKWVIKELDLIHDETGKDYMGIVYDLFLEQLKTIQELRNFKSRCLDDLSVNAMRKEINEILDKYERPKMHKQNYC